MVYGLGFGVEGSFRAQGSLFGVEGFFGFGVRLGVIVGLSQAPWLKATLPQRGGGGRWGGGGCLF